MAKDNQVEAITSMDENFAQWYTDVILKTELVDYAPVKGFMVGNNEFRKIKQTKKMVRITVWRNRILFVSFSCLL